MSDSESEVFFDTSDATPFSTPKAVLYHTEFAYHSELSFTKDVRVTYDRPADGNCQCTKDNMESLKVYSKTSWNRSGCKRPATDPLPSPRKKTAFKEDILQGMSKRQVNPDEQIISATPTALMLSNELDLFDLQFRSWNYTFESWKYLNIAHKDEEAFIEYEKQWADWKYKMLKEKLKIQKTVAETAVSSDTVTTDPGRVQQDHPGGSKAPEAQLLQENVHGSLQRRCPPYEGSLHLSALQHEVFDPTTSADMFHYVPTHEYSWNISTVNPTASVYCRQKLPYKASKKLDNPPSGSAQEIQPPNSGYDNNNQAPTRMIGHNPGMKNEVYASDLPYTKTDRPNVATTLSQGQAHGYALLNPDLPPGPAYYAGDMMTGGICHNESPIFLIPPAKNTCGTTTNAYGSHSYSSRYGSLNQAQDYSTYSAVSQNLEKEVPEMLGSTCGKMHAQPANEQLQRLGHGREDQRTYPKRKNGRGVRKRIWDNKGSRMGFGRDREAHGGGRQQKQLFQFNSTLHVDEQLFTMEYYSSGLNPSAREFIPSNNSCFHSADSSSTGFIDTHCHLDRLFRRENHKGTHADYIRRHRDSYPANYEGCVTVFCDPFSFQQVEVWQKCLSEKGVWGAFGCHPHNAMDYTATREAQLCYALEHPKVIALGEIGLDYSKRNRCSKRRQHEVMRRQLHIAMRRQLPLVIHCRDANEDCMKIMKEVLPRDHSIHLHCFTGDWVCAQEWLRSFPNLMIGITNLVNIKRAKCTHEVAKKISLKRLLLETDAPYFVPIHAPKYSRVSHPGMACHVANEIAAIRHISVDKVIINCRRNTRQLYGI